MKICMKVFWNPADSKNAVRSSSEAEKLSKFDIQNFDIAKFWSIFPKCSIINKKMCEDVSLSTV